MNGSKLLTSADFCLTSASKLSIFITFSVEWGLTETLLLLLDFVSESWFTFDREKWLEFNEWVSEKSSYRLFIWYSISLSWLGFEFRSSSSSGCIIDYMPRVSKTCFKLWKFLRWSLFWKFLDSLSINWYILIATSGSLDIN